MRNALGSVQSVLVLGGGSDIALATVRQLVADRTRTVVLAARAPDSLGPVAEELREAGATTVETVPFDAADVAGHTAVVDAVFDRHGDLDLAIVAFGVLGRQEEYIADPLSAASAIQVNFTATATTLLAVARRMRAQGHGTIVVLSSVAAERPRRSNFVYGSTKSGADAFAQGLGDELIRHGVRVVVVRPGMVRTKMTAGLDDAPFTTTPDAVAADIVAGIRRGAHTVWSPAVLRHVMTVLRLLPRPLFRRLDL